MNQLHSDLKTAVLALFALLAVASIGCAKPTKSSDLTFQGRANSFSELKAHGLAGKPIVEASLVNFGGELLAFYDLEWSGSMHRASVGADARSFQGGELVSREARFQYTLDHEGKLYTFALVGRDILLTQSEDAGLTWTPANDGQPVLTHSDDPTSIYHQLWNVGVDIDDQGVWHLLVESGDSTPAQGGVGLAYSTAVMTDGRINFDANRSASHVVSKGGNPWVKSVPGRGLLVVHGQVYTPEAGFGIEWFVTASTLENGTWVSHRDEFRVGTPQVHVCDPHIAELPNGGMIMSVSFDQVSTSIATSNISADALFNDLRGAN